MLISISCNTTPTAPKGWTLCACCPKGPNGYCRALSPPKTGELESIDNLRVKFDEATKSTDLVQLGIAPQCGFASTEEGNTVTLDDQRRKLELVVKTTKAIRGQV
ncbi:MAG: 5-methyltetrahydropteroyltriglutamate--homocysteine methyltransferase [Paracoccaceae bacterium]|jgi:5-methyltetrahydropteroyltriglutamate--homocysteine methyltransferase